jgi:uncharacterized spore protein YtfJ
MSEAEEMEPIETGQIAGKDDTAAIDAIETTMDTFLSAACVEAVYGEPVKQQDVTIIPAAEVVAVMGFGMGYGGGGSGGEEGSGQGGGGGGGGRVFSRPVAVVVISPDGVRVEPVFDLTKVVIAALTSSVFIFSMFTRMGRMEKDLRRFQRKLSAG